MVAITFTWFQDSVNTTTIYPVIGVSPNETAIATITDYAHSLGLKVLYRPLVDPNWSKPGNQGTWRGMIGNYFNTSQWDEWFASYSAYILQFAQVAEQLKVESFSVGAEIDTTARQETYWRALVQSIREVYSGQLTYGANWGYENCNKWWDAMDYVSVDAYYPLLTATNTPTVEELLVAWTPIVWYLESIAMQQNKSIAFTECGYCSSEYTFVEPAHCNGSVYQQNQVNAYEALFQAFFQQPWFMGVHFWAWLTDPNDGGVNDGGYSPHNKPASQVMQKYLTGQ